MLNKKQITALKAITSKHNARPILSNILISKDKIEINNLEYSLQLFGDYPVQSNNEAFLMPQTQFFKLAENLDYIHNENEKAIIGKGKTVFKFPAYNASEYPETPEDHTIEGLELATICNLEDIAAPFFDAAQFSSSEANRYSLNSVKIDFKNSLMIGTDQVQLRAAKFSQTSKRIESAIIPSSLAPMLKALNDLYASSQVSVKCSENILTIESQKFRIVTRQVEAQFPQYIQAIENFSQAKGQDINIKDLESSLKDISLVLCENAMMIKAQANLYNLELSASTPIGEASNVIAVDKENFNSEENQYCGVNPRLLKNYIKTVKKLKQCEIVIQSPKKPVIIRDSKGFLFMSPVSL